jgi:hypothetical protein
VRGSSNRPGTVTKTPMAADVGREPADFVNNEELKRLRFSRHVTAFDVDITALEDHPWRSKNVDLLDYFNYGFNERTWMVRNIPLLAIDMFYLILCKIIGIL